MSKNNNSLVSIIVPVYNVEKYLKRCVDSIIEQTYNNLEVILVDDGSLDNSGKICDDYSKKDKRIKVIHKKNGGLSDARNFGIKNCTGDFVSFIDSDDWVDKNMIESLLNILMKHRADVSCCKMIRTYDNLNVNKLKKFNKEIKVFNKDEYLDKFFKVNTQECVYYACNKLYKRELLEENQYPYGLTAEDVLGTFKVLLKTNKIVEINYPYYYYYYNPNSITGSKFSNRIFDMITVWDEVVKISKNVSLDCYNKALINRYRIDLNILMHMALRLNYNEIITNYKEQFYKLFLDLKSNKKVLLNASIPLSRKIVIILMLFNYKFFVNICGVISRR